MNFQVLFQTSGPLASSRSCFPREESVRIDRERAAQEALRQKEEEEQRRREAEELESQAKQAEAAEQAKKEKIQELMEEAKQLLPPEPSDGSACLQFLIRTPDGRRLKRAFAAENTIAQVYAFVLLEGGEAVRGRSFRLVETMPRRTYEDRDLTLAAAGLKGPCTLLVEFIDD
ncbi:FAS-associated factor 1 [Durusdinium trenchii]|uniref:FAS-associated factor 1 n=1 Tax=Durusdinium trenchii TaxID=1381693 RepID=A0ABP0LY80_9DINO|eukprot:g23411.t1